jgi:hypothetical protein
MKGRRRHCALLLNAISIFEGPSKVNMLPFFSRSTKIVAAVTRRIDLVKLWRIETFRPEHLTKSDRKLGRVLGIAIVAIISVAAARQGALTYRENLATAAFYQAYFGPGLNFACNGEYNEIKPNEEVQRFLERKSNGLDSCSGVEGLPVRTIIGFESSMVYLESASAIAWRLLGFNWENLFVIAAALSSGLALAGYGLLRVFFVSRLTSAALTFMFMSSAPLVAQIPHLRDFSKAPFLIGALACIGAAVLRPHRLFAILLFAIGAGASVSIGLGFRPDLKVVLPIALLSPLLLIGSDALSRTAGRIALIWIGFGAGYIAFRLPANLIGGVEGGVPATNIPHFFILGFAEPFLQAVGMSDGPYSVFRPYYDEFAYAMVNLFGNASHESPIPWGSVQYDQVGADLLRSIVSLVPYDTLFRIFYTANVIGHLPTNARIWGLPLLLLTPFLLLVRLRCFLFAILALGTLIAALSLQYDPRHAFYMSLLGPIIIALSASALLDIMRRVRASGFYLPPRIELKAGSLLLSVGLLAALLAAVSQVFAGTQRKALQNLVSTYSRLEWKSIKFRATQNGIQPEFINAESNQAPALALKQSTEGNSGMLRATETLSRVTLKLQPIDLVTVALPIGLSWRALQEHMQLTDKQFTLSTNKGGYVMESNPISGPNLSLLLANKKDGDQKVWLRITGETLAGTFYVGIFNHDKNKFAVVDRLPSGKVRFFRQFRITPDLNQFTILFGNYGGVRSDIRVDSVELVTFPATACWTPNARMTADYSYVGQEANLGGFILPEHSGFVTYYFPQTFAAGLKFTGLKLEGLSPDCIVDWSIAKDFPAGTVPAELLLTDGRLEGFQRGDWASVWRDFIR